MSTGAIAHRAAALAALSAVDGVADAVAPHVAVAAVGACVGAAVIAAGIVLRPRSVTRRLSVDHGGPGTWVRGNPAAPGAVRAATRAETAVRRAARPICVAAMVLVAGPPATALAILVAMVMHRWRRARVVARQRRTIAAAYPDAIDMVVLGVRAGLLPSAAMAAATEYVPAAVRPAFTAVAARVDRGDRFADALLELDAHIGGDARPLIDSFAAADRYGLPLAPVLERLATEARQQRRRVADTAARQLPVRLSLPLVLCTLPSFVLLAIVPLLLGAFSSLHTQ